MNSEKKMITPKTWKEFKGSGLLWWVNMILHTFGWAIVYEVGDGEEPIKVYPARVKFRGFDEKNTSEGYIKISEYLRDNIILNSRSKLRTTTSMIN